MSDNDWIDIDALEAAAKAAQDASPGQWYVTPDDIVVDYHGGDRVVADCSHSTRSVANFIVVDNPAAILRLIAALRERSAEAQVQGDRAEQAEALAQEYAAEIAAYQGRPEGGLPGWERHGQTYRRLGVGWFALADATSGPAKWYLSSEYGFAMPNPGTAEAPTVRAAMRAAEAKARELGLLPVEGA